MKQVKIRFYKNGETTVETTGFVGASCLEASRPYERALGAKVEDVAKPEQFETISLNEGLCQS